MEPTVSGADSTSLPAPGVANPTHPPFPATVPATPPPLAPEPAVPIPATARPAGGTALAVAKIGFVLALMIIAAVLAVLGVTVGAILALFGGVGMLAIELLNRVL